MTSYLPIIFNFFIYDNIKCQKEEVEEDIPSERRAAPPILVAESGCIVAKQEE